MLSCGANSDRPKRAVKRTPCSQWTDGYGADFGPSRGDPCRPAFRPIEASKAANGDGCFTSTPAVREASSASFDMIGFRLVDHDGWEFLAGQEPSSPIWSSKALRRPQRAAQLLLGGWVVNTCRLALERRQ